MENEFDNDISIIYKEAQKLNILTKFVKISNNIVDNKEIKSYSNLILLIENRILAGVSLYDLYSQFSISPEDLAMIYYKKNNKKNNILEEINNFYESIELSEVRDLFELKLLVQQFDEDMENKLLEEKYKLEDLEIIQDELSKNKPVKYSKIKLTSITLIADMIFKGKAPKIKDGYEIFDLSQNTSDFPYLKWNTFDNRMLYKLYSGTNLEERPDYNLIIPDTSEKNIANFFYFSIWSEKEKNKSVKEKKNINKESYLNGTYNLEKNLMKIKIQIREGDEKNIIIERIENVLPLTFNKIAETTISGDFYMFDVQIDHDIFYHMLMNFELMNTYLFQKEISTPAALTNQLRLYYRGASDLFGPESGSAVSFSISQNYAKGGESVTISNGEKMRLSPNSPYIRVSISSAESLETAERFVKIFSRLLTYYKINKNDIRRLYQQFIPELKNLNIKKPISNIGKVVSTSKISRLQELAPDLFISGYARKCLCPVQPIIIPDDEIKAWESKTISFGSNEMKRQIMKFPPNNPKWNIVCPEDSYPFPGVKYNNDLHNKDIYKGLPCCFKKDQLNSESNYKDLYIKESSKYIAKGDHIIKTDKIAKVDSFGLLPASIVSLISQYSDKSGDILRMGVPRSLNSLLHCMSIAINDPKYIKSKNKEKYVENLRNVISVNTNPSLIKQEMYDFSDEEIKSQINDNDIFFDPNLFYRAVEESYNVNLYIFAPSSNEKVRLKSKSESDGVMELPRFKLIYAKSPRLERQCILVYKTLGSESDNLFYPQCELIVDQNKFLTSVFNKEMNNILFSAYESLNKNIGWELVDGDENINILGRENVFSQINYFDLFKHYNPSKQYIDSYGKMRGMNITFENQDMMIVFPPSQPENLGLTSDLIYAPIDSVIKFLGTPIAASKDNDQIDGLWFTVLDLIYGVYVPIVPTDNHLNLQIGPSNPLGNKGVNIVPNIVKIKRDLDFTMQVLKWLFIINLKYKNLNYENFMNTYVMWGNGGDSKEIYEFKNIGRNFPLVDSVIQGINQISLRVPTLIKNEKIYLYSKKYYDGIKYILAQWIKERVSRYTKVPNVINRIYLSQKDFIQYAGISLFLTERDLRTWLSTLYKLNYENIKIDNLLSVSRALQTDPYLYESPEGNIYYIQNVIGGDLKRTLNVGIYWDDLKINPGYKADEYDDDIKELSYVIYNISEAKYPVLVENYSKSDKFISVLRYSNNNYASMLKLH